MPAAEQNAIIIIFDIGASVSKSLIHGETFFNQSRDCISWIIKRKIMSESKDLISLLLSGTDELDETLYDLNVNLKANVTLKYDFQLACWEMLNFIDNEIKTTDKISDWVGALAVATEKLKSLEESFNILSKRVVVFSDLSNTFSAEIVSIFNKIKESNIEITIIGSDEIADKLDNENCDEPLPKKRRLEELQNSEKLNGKEYIYLMCDLLGDLFRICTFELALRLLGSYSKKVVRSNPWNCNLEIGDLKIRVQMFKKIDRKISHRYTLKVMNQGDERRSSHEFFPSSFTDVMSHSVMHYKHLDQKKFETKEVSVEKDDVIGGFRYGASIIPYSAEDKSVLGYKPGRKQFSVLGFTRKATVPYYILTGEGSYIVVPYHLDDKAEIALSALIQAMHETDSVAIVRRVFSDDRGMSLGVLYPLVEDLDQSCHKECFIFIELAFAEDIRSFQLPHLNNIKKRISSRQKELINDLIDEMDLMKADTNINGNIHEALDLSSRHEMVNQFFQHCIVHKALYPDKPLPETVPRHCKKFLMQPESLARKGEAFSERLKNLFSNEEKKLQSNVTLKSGEQKFGVKGIEFYKMFDSEKLTAKNCFEKLFTLYRYPTQNEIRNLLMLSVKEFNFTQNDIAKAFLHYTSLARQQTLKDYTDDYNYWIRRLRINLGIEGQLEREYWNGVYKDNLGLITYEENSQSNIKTEDARLFMNSLKPKVPEDKEVLLQKSKEVEAAIDMLF